MIRDLATAAQPAAAEAQVCIVGAGIAGLLLACELRRSGLQVVVVESGGRSLDSDEHPLNEIVNLGEPYHGATRGRVRCLGGTSTRWGGALIPFLPADLDARPTLNMEAWPVSFAELVPHIEAVERAFGVTPGPYEIPVRIDAARDIATTQAIVVERSAKWPTFRNRNVATLFKREIDSDDSLQVWLNATVTNFELAENGRLTAIRALSMSGSALEIRAQAFVLCPGAIEATRLLLLLDRQYGGRVFSGCEALGRYFYDHVSVMAARLVPPRPSELNKLAGFRFSGRTMRSPRFELAPQLQADQGLPSAFAHISFEGQVASGFDTLRNLLRSVQKRGFPDPRIAVGLVSDVPYLLRLAYWRFARGQLLWPSGSSYHLHVVAEQLPRASNRITLSDQLDPLGQPRAALTWKIEEQEHSTIRSFAQHFERFWKLTALDEIAAIEWNIDRSLANLAGGASPNDIYHPGGSTRMGRDTSTSVVNEKLQTHVVENLYIASTSSFPAGASANPTLMLMAFTLRLAEHLIGLYHY